MFRERHITSSRKPDAPFPTNVFVKVTARLRCRNRKTPLFRATHPWFLERFRSPALPFADGVLATAARTLKPGLAPTGTPDSLSVTRGFARAGPPAPGQAALPASERAAAMGLPRAPVHFRRPEGLRLEVPLRGFSLAIGCRAGWILSIPRNEQWMVQPYIQPMRPQPPLPGRTPRRPIRLPRQRHRHVPGPMLPGRASKISPLQQ